MAMAEVECTCSVCGRKFKHRRKCYNRERANSYEEWAEDHIDTCPECFAGARRQAELDKACAETADLPKLEGTEKQVAWATVIRAEMLRSNPYALPLNEHMDRLDAFVEEVKAKRDILKPSELLVAEETIKIFTETSAKWFIEHRH